MTVFETGLELFKKLGPQMDREVASAYIGPDLPFDMLETARRNFAPDATRDNTIGMISESLLDTGRSGILFTDKKIYFSGAPFKPLKIWYDEIIGIDVEGKVLDDESNSLLISLVDGTTVKYTDTMIKKQPFIEFVAEMVNLQTRSDYSRMMLDSKNNDTDFEAEAAGTSAMAFGALVDQGTGNLQSVDNLLFDEYKWKGSGAHGFTAERANNLSDRIKGADARILGDNNVKNGPDRLIVSSEGRTWIQSKYCNTGKGCIDKCFDNETKQFRYYEEGRPMQVEVPADDHIYEDAVSRMRERVSKGQVPGVNDPDDAVKLVRRGTVTYDQAVNIAKAGTVESLIYDTVNGMVISTSAFGISAVVSFAASIWNGEPTDTAITKAAASGLKVGGTALCTTVLTSQLYKAGAAEIFANDADAFVQLLGKNNSLVLINSIRTGEEITAASAQKALSKLLRGNALTAVVALGVISTFDVADAYLGRISESQMAKNIVSTSSSVIGGMGGYLGGIALGSALIPGIGPVVAGLIGSIAIGGIAGSYTRKVMDIFIEDDAVEMIHIIDRNFADLAFKFIISQDEAEKITDKISKAIDSKTLKDMFSSDDRNQFAQKLLVPYFEEIVKRRKHIKMPADEVLEEKMVSIVGEAALAN